MRTNALKIKSNTNPLKHSVEEVPDKLTVEVN